jgi:hypothetical protein
MALEKDIVIDLIQILPDRQIQVREIRRVLEDGVVVATGGFHRFVLDPGLHDAKDVEAVNPELFSIVNVLWTPEVVNARKKFIAEQEALRATRFQPIDVIGEVTPSEM